MLRSYKRRLEVHVPVGEESKGLIGGSSTISTLLRQIFSSHEMVELEGIC